MAPKSKIEVVCFDAAGTLLYLDGVHQKLMEISGRDKITVVRAWRAVDARAGIGRYSRDEASCRLAATLEIKGPFDAEDCVFRPSRSPVLPMHGQMLLLADAGVRVGVASDAWDEMVEISIKDNDIPNIPGMKVWVSSNARMTKSNPRAWKSIARTMGCQVKDMMMVDDRQDICNLARAGGVGEVFKVDTSDLAGSAMLLHAKLIQLGLLREGE